MRSIMVVLHVISGSAGLVLGLAAMIIDTRRFAAGLRTVGRCTIGYVAVVLVVCLTGSGLVLLGRPDLWWLIPLSALTFGLSVLAQQSAARRFRGWTHGYAHGIGGSYIAQTTALIVVALVVNGPLHGAAELIPWLAPTMIGTVLLELWRRRLPASIPKIPAAAPADV